MTGLEKNCTRWRRQTHKQTDRHGNYLVKINSLKNNITTQPFSLFYYRSGDSILMSPSIANIHFNDSMVVLVTLFIFLVEFLLLIPFWISLVSVTVESLIFQGPSKGIEYETFGISFS